MNDTETLELAAAEAKQARPDGEEALDAEAQAGTDAKTEEQPKEPTPEQKRIAELEAALKQKDARISTLKGNGRIAAKVVKGLIDEYGLTYDEAVKHVGNMNPNDLKARLETVDLVDNPIEHQVQAFDALYVQGGVKGTLDDIYGEDTQPFVVAFSQIGLNDPQIAAEFESMEPAKLPAYVVKTGKELLAKKKATESLADENQRLKAELEALKAGKTVEGVVPEKRKSLPLSGGAGFGTNGGSGASGLLPEGMF
jgi:hypothetical protein